MKKMKKIFLFSLMLGGVLLTSKCQDDSYLEPEITTQEVQKENKKGKNKLRKKLSTKD